MIEVAKIVNTHGVRGDIKAECWCDSADVFFELDTVFLKDGTQYQIESAKTHKNHLLIHFEGVDSIEEAEKLKNKILYADENDFELDEDVYFIKDIIGIEVFDADTNEKYGKITEVLQNSSKDVYVIKGEDREYLVPAVEECIIHTDIDEKVMKIRPLKGLFD